MVRLGDVCSLETGSRNKGGALKSGIPSIGGEHVNKDGSINFGKMKYVSPEHFNSMRQGKTKKGDVLLVKDGATTGKVGYLGDIDKNMAVNEHVFILRHKENTLPYYLYILARSNNFQKEIKKRYKGIIGGVDKDIDKIKIPIPPIKEQQRIVNMVSTWDNAVENLKKQIAAHKKQRLGITQKLLGDNLKDCPMGCLGDVIKINFGTRITKKRDSGTKYFVYGGGNKTFKTDHYNRSDDYVIARFAMSAECVRYVPGKFWLLDSGGTFSINQSHKDNVSREFIGILLIENQKNIFNCARGLAQQNLDEHAFNSIKIPLPNMKEQNKIVANLSIYDNKINLLEQLLNKYELQRKGLIQKLLGGITKSVKH